MKFDISPEAIRKLRQRCEQFYMLQLPGQMQMMHMGTCNLVTELENTVKALVEELNAANTSIRNLKARILKDRQP